MIDFKQNRLDDVAEVLSIEYDPNRSARIALIQYSSDNEKAYILAADGMSVGMKIVVTHTTTDIIPGNRLQLRHIPSGTMVHNVELTPNQGGSMVRSAGSSAVLMSKEGKYAQLKMPSGEIRLIKKECLATVGSVSNPDHRLVRIGKAGRKRHMGIRPTVRGKAMNPCDHPHGGGEGRHPIGLKYPKTKWNKAPKAANIAIQ